MKETIETIIKWHRETFPDATLEGQTNKWFNEEKEFKNTIANTEEEIYELADLVIVSAGIMRFDYAVGFNFLCGAIGYLYTAGYDGIELWKAVDKKMQINRKREWNFINGQYQHKELAE